MTLQPVLTYLIAQLKTALHTANVYEALPLTSSPVQLIAYFDEHLQAWEVSNPSGVGEEAEAGNLVHWVDTIRIDGWRKYNNADDAITPKQQFQAQVDTLKVFLLNNPTLGHTVHGHTPLRLVFAQADYFNNILCHHCRFEFQITTLIALSNE